MQRSKVVLISDRGEERRREHKTEPGHDFKTLADVLVQETIRSLLREEVSKPANTSVFVDVWVCDYCAFVQQASHQFAHTNKA